jgi:hypothetical protein
MNQPTPYELAALAIQLCGRDAVEKDQATALLKAGRLWLASEQCAEKIGDDKLMTLAAKADDEERTLERGDISEEDVMKMAKIQTPSHFLKRATEFFEADWTALCKNWPYLQNHIPNQKTLALRALSAPPPPIDRAPDARDGRVWYRSIAIIFAEWLHHDRREKGRINATQENPPSRSKKSRHKTG